MLRELLSVLNEPDQAAGATVPELAARLGLGSNEVRVGLWQLERLGLLRRCASTGVSAHGACTGCFAREACGAGRARAGATPRQGGD